MTVATRPNVYVAITASLQYLNLTQTDVSTLINAVKTAVMNAVNDLAPGTALTVAMVSAAVVEVPGIAFVRGVELDGDVVPLPASDGGFIIDVANEVGVDCRIAPQ